ncbi:hypothetical protein [Clostridium luticellarii]|jgi:hypothetical protein|uniref:Uncharacterized protein n=1 Tax=Clostridium luticellarii TaxID=1691940 RepID=A0A2T0B445_9CLOT|nr:hypothetical protein [Clostridium luticellarii]MCI1944165.1 hypothetical protein [Clostridium luticellarii]MCI1967667.1 hypothetical protein [Clostridium luticellarii]PRR78654.1 hypothetical protein CLLU_36160 [Clostridium luticellarii]
MYDIKNFKELEESKNKLRANCIGDRGYFNNFQYQSMFELKSIHVPIKSIIK